MSVWATSVGRSLQLQTLLLLQESLSRFLSQNSICIRLVFQGYAPQEEVRRVVASRVIYGPNIERGGFELWLDPNLVRARYDVIDFSDCVSWIHFLTAEIGHRKLRQIFRFFVLKLFRERVEV